jgi:PhnB protein
MSVKPIPDGYHAITPYLLVKNVADEIEFLKKAFDAEVNDRVDSPAGTMHAALRIRDSMIMLGHATDKHPVTPVLLYLYVEDADAAFAKAVKAGGTVFDELKDQYYGDRSGCVTDENGNQWWVASRKENLSNEEIGTRSAAAKAAK